MDPSITVSKHATGAGSHIECFNGKPEANEV